MVARTLPIFIFSDNMDTRHTDKYSAEECEAYREVAAYKWDETFLCSRPGCGCTRYFEGKKPFSRRCLKCKRDESPTAHTLFDKLRMPLHKSLGIVKMMMESAHALRPEDVIDRLVADGNRKGVDKRAVEAFLRKVLERILEVTSIKSVYEQDALFLYISFRQTTILLSEGIVNGQVGYQLDYSVAGPKVDEFITEHTLPSTRCAVFIVAYITRDPVVTRHVLKDRPALPTEMKKILKLGHELYHCGNDPTIYYYKKNGNELKDLMKLIVSSPNA